MGRFLGTSRLNEGGGRGRQARRVVSGAKQNGTPTKLQHIIPKSPPHRRSYQGNRRTCQNCQRPSGDLARPLLSMVPRRGSFTSDRAQNFLLTKSAALFAASLVADFTSPTVFCAAPSASWAAPST